MEVEQNSAEVGHFMVLDANENEDSMTGFTPASRVTHDILVKCNADASYELVQAWLHVCYTGSPHHTLCGPMDVVYNMNMQAFTKWIHW